MALGGLLGTLLLAAGAVCLGSGCSTIGYYAQAAGGHLDVLVHGEKRFGWNGGAGRRLAGGAQKLILAAGFF